MADTANTASSGRRDGILVALSPIVFVLLWSTGFIGARYAMPHAEPMTFLTLRFVLGAALLAAFTLATGGGFRLGLRDIGHLAVAGILMQATYLGGVFAAIAHGLEAGTSALIVGVQPILTAALAGPLLGERVRPMQWLGLALGLAGVTMVVGEKLGAGLGTPLAVGLNVLSLLGIAIGTIYQKRFCQDLPMRAGIVVQFAAAALACGALALVFETGRIEWTGELVFALLWLTLVLSLGAVSLLYVLIRRGAASNVASLFFLVPPSTAAIAWLLFAERMPPLALAGMGVAVTGVLVVTLSRRG
ncbi:DMT family transporter [Futiania mangrovi]|uniref:DMT family transporter n=1 Tax=Futiania mangrovi TaxID=2959716 RepID=A0A9J6PDX4_9PROT|nr:DMT family transporter [Futiania mangrovii]MCP1335939.1 DMT family transporter [Futiania mangrovii]